MVAQVKKSIQKTKTYTHEEYDKYFDCFEDTKPVPVPIFKSHTFFDLFQLEYYTEYELYETINIVYYEPKIACDAGMNSKILNDDILAVSKAHLHYLKQALSIGITLFDVDSKSKSNWTNIIRDLSKTCPHTSPESFNAYCVDSCRVVIRNVRQVDNRYIIYYGYDLLEPAGKDYYSLPAFRSYLRTIYKAYKLQEVIEELDSIGEVTHRLGLGLQNDQDVVFGISSYINKSENMK